MKAVVVMYDSLNKHYLSPYGNKDVITPNFSRLAKHAAVFDNFYTGSLPCMPARRELHTGRYNFLHRSWGPLEPFDDSMPQMLRDNGVYTHLITDHCHYWEDGGATYHNRFASYEFIRGQEGDPWKADVAGYKKMDVFRQDAVNRRSMRTEEEHYHTRACNAALEFLDTNSREDNWYLQLEYFDPHEPFTVPERFIQMYTDEPVLFDWPQCQPLKSQGEENIAQAVVAYKALLTMCDHYLGKILDAFDRYGLWKDTMLIVNTDHGYMLGEKGCVGKNYMPPYQEIVNTPFFIWDPRCGLEGVRRSALAQTMDIAPTLLSLFGFSPGRHMQGKDLLDAVRDNVSTRNAVLFGYHGMHVNVADGRYVYMRGAQDPQNQPLYEYTLMPTRIKRPFFTQELKQMDPELYRGFEFAEHTPMMRIPSDERYDKRIFFQCSDHTKYGTLLFDLQSDPLQVSPLKDPDLEAHMIQLLRRAMEENEAPEEQYKRLGL